MASRSICVKRGVCCHTICRDVDLPADGPVVALTGARADKPGGCTAKLQGRPQAPLKFGPASTRLAPWPPLVVARNKSSAGRCCISRWHLVTSTVTRCWWSARGHVSNVKCTIIGGWEFCRRCSCNAVRFNESNMVVTRGLAQILTERFGTACPCRKMSPCHRFLAMRRSSGPDA